LIETNALPPSQATTYTGWSVTYFIASYRLMGRVSLKEVKRGRLMYGVEALQSAGVTD